MLRKSDILLPLLALALGACSPAARDDEPGAPAHELTGTFDVAVASATAADPSLAAGTFDPVADAGAYYADHSAAGAAYFAAPRELDCTNSWQQVNNVRAYAFRKSGEQFLYYRPYDLSAAFSAKFAATPYAYYYGPALEAKGLEIRPWLAPGEYRFLMVARDVAGNLADAWSASTTLDAALASATIPGHEIFAGVSPSVTVNDGDISFKTAVTASRLVAGLLIYLENIPAGTATVAVATDAGETLLSAAVTATTLLAGTYIAPVDDTALSLLLLDAAGSETRRYALRRLRDNHSNAYNDLRYPLEANNIYCLGEKRYSPDGATTETDQPVDLGEETTTDLIIVESEWQAEIDIEL